MNVIKKLSMKVEQDHSRQLQDIRNIEDNAKKFVEGGKDSDNKVPVDFEKLVGSSGGAINGNTRNSIGNGSIEIPPDPFDTPGISALGSSNMVHIEFSSFSIL
jgi:hypothetical protein